MATTTTPNRLLSPPETAAFLGVSLSCLAKWRCYGRGPRYTRAGRAVRYRVAELEQWLADRTVGPSDEA